MVFGMAGFKPVPAIVVAQALNGLILPVIALFLFGVVNHPNIMKNSFNRLPANICMTMVVFFSLLIGMMGLARAVAAGMGLQPGNWAGVFLGVAGLSVLIISGAIYRISSWHKQEH
jgi:Mn2+/Fe2+ NRAMP family transporter